MSTTPSNARLVAEDALWHALEERRKHIKAAGVRFNERQHHQFRKAHDKGNLIQTLCGAMESYKGSVPNETNLRAMAQTIKHDLPTWEHVLIRTRELWTPYVTPGARRGARRSIADARAWVDASEKSKSVRAISGGAFETNRRRH